MYTVGNTSQEIKQWIEDKTDCIAVIPIGAIEQHGPHLPLGTDWIIAREMGERLAKRLGAYLLPALCYGNSQEHMGFKGTISLRPSTLALVIEDIVLSLSHHGIKKIVIFSAHGGNWIIKPTLRDLNFRYPDLTIIWSDGALPGEKEKIPEDIHSGKDETSIMLATKSQLVKETDVDFTPPVGQEYLDYVGIDKTTPTGIWGMPTQSSAEYGEEKLSEGVERAAKYIQATFDKLQKLKEK